MRRSSPARRSGRKSILKGSVRQERHSPNTPSRWRNGGRLRPGTQSSRSTDCSGTSCKCWLIAVIVKVSAASSRRLRSRAQAIGGVRGRASPSDRRPWSTRNQQMKRFLSCLGFLLIFGSAARADVMCAPFDTIVAGQNRIMSLPSGASVIFDSRGCTPVSSANDVAWLRVQGYVPQISGLGTGVYTALQTNVGTAGSIVVNGGALGTPSSGTLTSVTGLPISTGISGLGTGVATALATNVGTAGSPVVNGGALGTNVGTAASIVRSGGALGTPSSGTLTSATGLPISTGISGLGTGVATALAVNVGTAGSPVVNGGALGTPSSGTLTSVTGLPISTGVSGLGTGVATALAVNVGTAGSIVVNGGALGTPSSGTLTSVTGLPISTGISGLGTGVATALAVNVGTAGSPVVHAGGL